MVDTEIMVPLYTVKRVGARYVRTHGSTDARATTCGLNIDHNWMVLSNAFDGAITCPKCCAAIRDLAYSELP